MREVINSLCKQADSLACFTIYAYFDRRRRAATAKSAPATSSAGTMSTEGRPTASAAMQPVSSQTQQSAKPKGKGVSRLGRASESPLSSGSDGSSSASSSEGDEDEEEGNSEEEDANSTSSKQQARDHAPIRQASGQQIDDYADDAFQQLAQQHHNVSPVAAASALQQQQQQQQRAAHSNALPAALDKGGDSTLAVQQVTRQHMEHMHVAVRTRPIPSGSSLSCWVIDPSAATITLNGSANAAKRKQALAGSTGFRSSNNSGLDGGQSRGLLGTAPSIPGSGFWDSSAPAGTSMGYRFDQVLDESAETAAVYTVCIQSLVHSALEGVNGTVLAYGKINPL